MIRKIQFKENSKFTKIIIKNKYIDFYLTKLIKSKRKIYCLVDSKLKYITKKHMNKKNFIAIFVNCGENIKSINTYNQLSNKLLSENIDRESILVAIGGGTLGDLSGFIASTILRGIDFKLIPTTLLSQVDSSIGGKNGINSSFGKNLIGTFYHPSEVIIDINILKTLPKREIKSGYAEIIKHSLIKDLKFFNWLEKNFNELIKLNVRILEKAILRSLMIKLWYVKKDQYEKLSNENSRAMLNFGHTIGHSLETYYKYNSKLNHGEAISIGMITESIISNKLGYLNDNNLNLIINHFKKAKLKIYDKNISKHEIFRNIVKDKKNTFNSINIVLIKKIGKPFFKRNLKIEQIKNILKKI